MPILTSEMIELFTKGGRSYRRKQAVAIGEPYPAKKGWKTRVIGKEITQKQLETFVRESNNKEAKEQYFQKSKKVGSELLGAFSLAKKLIVNEGKTLATAIKISSKNKSFDVRELESMLRDKVHQANDLKLQSKAQLYESIDDGVWLAENTRYTLKNIITKVQEKHGYKIKAHIEKGIRDRLPEDFFNKRAVKPKGSGEIKRSRTLSDWSNNQHMKSIMDE